MACAGVPTARSYVCTNPAEVDAALAAFGAPYVVKDDGLAAGKGVVVTDDVEAARAHANACDRVVVEEFLDGPEVSLFAVTDGENVRPLQPAQDFKRALDGDEGPNTGGMGATPRCPGPTRSWSTRSYRACSSRRSTRCAAAAPRSPDFCTPGSRSPRAVCA